MTPVLAAAVLIPAALGVLTLAVRHLNRAEIQLNRILRDELDPRYTVTAVTPGRPTRMWRDLTAADLAVLLHRLDVPSYDASAEHGDLTVTGTHITWQPTDTTGDTQ
jgi:hypothetical protein